MKTLVTLVLVFVGTWCFAQDPTKEEKKEDPIIVIDGIKYLRSDSTNALQKLNPEKIKEIKVLRGQDAINLYGEDGKSGVILVTTKANLANKPLFLLDGERVDDLASIDPTSIQSIEVIKDPAKLQPFGDAGSGGVVKITKRKGQLE
ncbi:MAG: TonB-dependent receptor plug domain-containing protein [Cytophagales bacterium]|nr:TonB-dependent receptor plug domain-containing protein [Cytophagales bacterium]